MVAILINEFMSRSSQSGKRCGGTLGKENNIRKDMKMSENINSTIRLGIWQEILEREAGTRGRTLWAFSGVLAILGVMSYYCCVKSRLLT